MTARKRGNERQMEEREEERDPRTCGWKEVKMNTRRGGEAGNPPS